uniref:Uncharacterized phage protein gp47/JayE n=1 Tax=Candidatus Kentrum sp. LPFa TaxID=2126335 RepID=A0A450WM47_9GAMM|nr:MAG: Uncharacterized phage protein gp47/JayE [Candidatus Kentron sp. LPFa]
MTNIVLYERPDYPALAARIEADLAAVPAVLRGPLSASWARACHGQYGYLDWIDAQCSPLTCELARLHDWAALYGVDRLAATKAAGDCLATGAAGSTLLADAELRGTNGLDYGVSSATTLGAGTTAVAVVCLTDGSAGNLPAGQTLTLIDPAPGVDNTLAVAAAGLTGGAPEESVDAWRLRVAEEWRVVVTRGARSGKPDDYRYWARSAHPSVTTALVQPHLLGVGTLVVRPLCDTLTDRLPTQAVLDDVSAYLLKIAPSNADWRVVAPVKQPVTVAIHLLAGFDTQQNRTAIASALNAAVLTEASENSVLTVAEINGAIATVTNQYTLNAPDANIAVEAGKVLVLEGVAWS